MKIVVITGMSGAGRSQAMKTFEDAGYYCIDNMPLALMPKFVELVENNTENIEKVALVADIRGRRFFDTLEKTIEAMKSANADFKTLFLEASNPALIKRYKEARRTHPLNPGGSIEDGINKERKRLEVIRNMADFIVDTSDLSLAAFRERINHLFEENEGISGITLTLMSFGFKKGIPLDADFVYDVRMLPNPFYIDELKPLTGNDEAVRQYVMRFPESQEYYSRLRELIEFQLPLCVKEGRRQLVIAIGCTGGQHRSVTFTNLLAADFEAAGHGVNCKHRELSP